MALEPWLPKSRRGGGEWTMNHVAIPTGVDGVRVQLDVTPADFTTPDLSVTAYIETSPDGGASWRFEMSTSWMGQDPPPTHRLGGQVGWFAAVNGLSQFIGMRVRVRFFTTGTFRWGLLGEMLDINGQPI